MNGDRGAETGSADWPFDLTETSVDKLMMIARFSSLIAVCPAWVVEFWSLQLILLKGLPHQVVGRDVLG